MEKRIAERAAQRVWTHGIVRQLEALRPDAQVWVRVPSPIFWRFNTRYPDELTEAEAIDACGRLLWGETRVYPGLPRAKESGPEVSRPWHRTDREHSAVERLVLPLAVDGTVDETGLRRFEARLAQLWTWTRFMLQMDDAWVSSTNRIPDELWRTVCCRMLEVKDFLEKEADDLEAVELPELQAWFVDRIDPQLDHFARGRRTSCPDWVREAMHRRHAPSTIRELRPGGLEDRGHKIGHMAGNYNGVITAALLAAREPELWVALEAADRHGHIGGWLWNGCHELAVRGEDFFDALLARGTAAAKHALLRTRHTWGVPDFRHAVEDDGVTFVPRVAELWSATAGELSLAP